MKRRPTEPKVWREVDMALLHALRRIEGLSSYRVGAQEGNKLIVEITLQPRQRAAVWKWWQARVAWMKGAQ